MQLIAWSCDRQVGSKTLLTHSLIAVTNSSSNMQIPHYSAGPAAAEGSNATSSLAHATHPLSPMSGREFDPYSANQKPPAPFDEVAQQKVLSSFGVAANDGLC